jgi:hypothetical protein
MAGLPNPPERHLSMARSLLRTLFVGGVAASALTFGVLPASAAPVGFTIDQETFELASIDAGTAVVTDIGGLNGDIDSLALACDNTLFATRINFPVPTGADAGFMEDSDELVTINTTTGAQTTIGDLGLSEREYGLAFAPDRTLWLSSNDSIYTVSTTTGATTLVGTTGDNEMEVRSLAFNAAGTLYGYDDDSGRLFTISTTTGAATEVGSSPYSMGNVAGLDFDSAGTLWAIASTDGTGMATFDLTTGEGTFQDTQQVDARGLALTALPCPTPASTTTTTSTSTTSTTAPTTTTTAAPRAVAVAVAAQPRFTG